MSKTVVIADNDADWTARMVDVFRGAGWNPVVERRGENIAALLDREDIDLTVIEYTLPGNVDRLAAVAVARDKGIPTPIIFTASADNPDIAQIEYQVRRLGADFFFIKPFNLVDLNAVADLLLDARSRKARIVSRRAAECPV